MHPVSGCSGDPDLVRSAPLLVTPGCSVLFLYTEVRAEQICLQLGSGFKMF